MTKKQKIMQKAKNRLEDEDYVKICIDADVCPACGCDIVIVEDVLDNEDVAFISRDLWACSSPKCNVAFALGDRNVMLEGYVDYEEFKNDFFNIKNELNEAYYLKKKLTKKQFTKLINKQSRSVAG